ncbi:MAG: hypothetical protein QM765_47875 [Myxococcales bacterium]
MERCDPALGCVESPRACDDGIACHRNGCDPGTRACVHTPDDSLCPDGQWCGEAGCIACLADGDCDDGALCTADTCLPDGSCQHLPDDRLCGGHPWCDGDYTCAPFLGCVVGRPRDCDDGIACDRNTCVEAIRSCTHTPDDSACPPTQLCGLSGCEPFIYAQTPVALYQVELPSGRVLEVGATGLMAFDLAFTPSRVLYGTQGELVFTLDRKTGVPLSMSPLLPVFEGMNALGSASDGSLYGAGGSTIYLIDPDSWTVATVAHLPSQYSSSGDLAFVGDALFTTVYRPGNSSDDLALVDLAAGTAKIVGPIGYSDVYGLAPYDGELYGFAQGGQILRIDMATGAGSLIAETQLQFYGAGSLPGR